MKILIDTNILIDYILERQPFTASAEKIIVLCKDKKIDGCIAAHSIMNIFYILRKEMTIEERKNFLYYLSQITEIVGVDKYKIFSALNNNAFADFEDSVQNECAKSFFADYVVTRNIKDFINGTVKPISPDDFLKLINL